MKPPSVRTAAAVGAAAIAASLLAASPAGAEPETAPAQDIDWQPCPEIDDAVDCATIDVPLDYTDPDGEQIQIGLARRQAADPDERIGTVLMDPGGPGGSGVESVMAANSLTDAAAEHFDIVGFDPRGINTSTQVKCSSEALDAVAQYAMPTDQETFDSLAAANAELTADCRERTGPMFDHMDNLNTVEDMEQIRLALDDGQLNFLGYSYGTLMGQQYAEVYPENVRSMVLDGNMDHSLEGTWEFLDTETAAVEENFLAFADWCDEDDMCALHGQDVTEVYAEIKAAARAGELIDPADGEPLDFYDLAGIYGFNANFPQFWPDLADSFEAMLAGETIPQAKVFQEPEETTHPYLPIWCQDWGFEVADYAEYAELNERVAEAHPNVEWTSYASHASACIGADIEQTNPRQPLDIEDAPPLMFIGNVHDYATVYPWSQTAAEQADGHLITYEGYWHTAYSGTSDCIDEAVDAYLIDLDVPEAGLSCANEDFPGEMTTLDAPGRDRTGGPF